MSREEEGKLLLRGMTTTMQEGSSIKSTFRDYVRVIFQRKKFIIIPVIAVPLCFAVYSFIIAEEIYRAENHIVVLDNKTNKPILGNLSTMSDLGKRIDTSVKRITSRNGIVTLIAGIDYVAAEFPDSALVQNKRSELLTDKRVILEYRLKCTKSKIESLETQLGIMQDGYKKQRIEIDLEELNRDRRICEDQIAELYKKIRQAGERVRVIARQKKEFEELVERSGREPENEELRLLCEAGKNRELEGETRLDKMVTYFLDGLKFGIHGNNISASFESPDPQLSKDVVDEVLLRLEFENLSIKKQEVLSTSEILDEKIHEYEQRVAKKENALKGYQSIHILDASPSELASTEFQNTLIREGAIMPAGLPAPHILSQYREYMKEHAEVQQQVGELTAERESLLQQLKSTPEFIEGSVVESVPNHVTRLKDELHAAEMERAKFLETMTEKHPYVIKVSDKIARLEQMLADSDALEVTSVERVKNPIYSEIESRYRQASSKLAGLTAREQEVAKQMEYYRRRSLELPRIVAEHSRLSRELSQDRNLLRELMGRKSGAEITQALEVDNKDGMRFEKPDPTALPVRPIRPNRRLLILLGLLLGGAAAAALLFFVEYADRSIRGIVDVKRHLGLPVLGTIPYFFRKDKNIRARKAFSARGAFNCALVTALITVLAISFFFDSEVSDFTNKQLGRDVPAIGYRKHQRFPGLFSNWRATVLFEDEMPVESTGAAALDAPEIEINPGVFTAEEGP